MHSRLDLRTALLLAVPSLLWAGNAVLGRFAIRLVPPITLNFLRWAIALIILLPLAGWVVRKGSPLWVHWRRYALLGLLGVGCYSALLYLTLMTSTPMNVTLISTSTPICSLFVGACFFGQRITARQLFGAGLSMLGVLVVISHGDWRELARLRLAPGDMFVLLSVVVWAFYGWLLVHAREPDLIRSDWAAFLLAQVLFGTGWASLFAAGELAFTETHFDWDWPLVLVLGYVAVAPTILAYRVWTLGVQLVGPPVAGFFGNLTPLFAAVMSAAFLGEPPRAYHAYAFVLIVGGILTGSHAVLRPQATPAPR